MTPSSLQCSAKADTFHYSCVDSILINGKGSVYCPGEDFLVNNTMDYMKWAIYPRHVNDKGYGSC